VDISQLHFSHPLWLWAGIAIPLVWIVFFLFYRAQQPLHQLERFIDKHLLPYLLVNSSNKESSLWKTLLLWSAVWSCLTLALAGPRWSFREMETFSRDQSLVILLDLSESMNAKDIKPSRLVRAKQKMEDLLNLSKGVKIGLIAFAADPHIITPVTEDKETIRHLLPSLETDLAFVQGSRLSSALDMAATLLEAEPGNNKAVLVISDGGFEDSSAIITAKKLAEKGLVIHAMGIGTVEGAPIQDHEGNIIKKNGTLIHSKLEKERLNEISKAGKGRYLDAHYSDHEEAIILKELEKNADAQIDIGKKKQFWDERFYLLIFPTLPIILYWFRRGYVFAMVLIFFIPAFGLEAAVSPDYFKNSEELGKQAFDDGDYETAIRTFQDPYRKGVAYYRAAQFDEAEKMFRQSFRDDVASSAAYNLGNTLVQQQKLKEAATAYEDVLKKWPDHTKAKENLELVKKMLEQQKQNSSESENSDEPQDQEKNGSEDKDKKESQDSDDSNNNEQQPQENEPQQSNEDREGQPEEQQEREETEASQKDPQEAKAPKSQEDQDADLWLNRMTNDPKAFLKNKFYMESKRNGTTEGLDPW
jgi:Ca-activated chloride channel family protein